MKRLNGFDKFAIALVIVAVCMLMSACAGTAKGIGDFFAGVGADIGGMAKGSTEAQAKEYEKQKQYEEFLVSTGQAPPR